MMGDANLDYLRDNTAHQKRLGNTRNPMHDLMAEPVVAADGFTYEREALAKRRGARALDPLRPAGRPARVDHVEARGPVEIEGLGRSADKFLDSHRALAAEGGARVREAPRRVLAHRGPHKGERSHDEDAIV